MNTIEHWVNKLNAVECPSENWSTITSGVVKQIQDDAYYSGLQKAAGIARELPKYGCDSTGVYIGITKEMDKMKGLMP